MTLAVCRTLGHDLQYDSKNPVVLFQRRLSARETSPAIGRNRRRVGGEREKVEDASRRCPDSEVRTVMIEPVRVRGFSARSAQCRRGSNGREWELYT